MDNRSTATTILAVRSLIELESNRDLRPEARKLLSLLVFCRHGGTAYYRVRLGADDLGIALFPREDRREEGDDGNNDAYLFISEQSPWPRTEGQELLDRLPESFKESNPQGVERIRSDAKKNIPESVYVDGGGHLVREGEGAEGALIHSHPRARIRDWLHLELARRFCSSSHSPYVCFGGGVLSISGYYGAEGGTRTLTPLRTQAFESVVSICLTYATGMIYTILSVTVIKGVS